MQIDGSGRVQLVQAMPVLRPDEQVLQMMLDGWRNQQLSRNLQFATIDQRLRCVQRFLDHVNDDPWNWTPLMVEEFSADLRTVRHVAHSTLRGYHCALHAFTSYISNPDYGWDLICEKYFGTHPAQVFFDWNTAPHVQEYDGRPTKRPYTREEISVLFDHADDEVERIGKSSRKGWQAAYRDAVMMKIAYAYGLRFNELRHLQTVDFARNPHTREFGPSASARSATARHDGDRRTSHAACSPSGAGPPASSRTGSPTAAANPARSISSPANAAVSWSSPP